MRQAHGEGLRVDPVGQRQPLGVEEHRHVDIAGIVQFEGALLTHGDAEPSGHRTLFAEAEPGDPPGLQLSLGRDREGRGDRRVGETGERARHLVQAPDPTQVGQCGHQVQLGFQLAQADNGGRVIEPGAVSGLPQELVQPSVRIGGQQRVQPARLAPRQSRQVGGRSENRRQRRPGLFQPRRPQRLGDDFARAFGGLGIDHRTAGLELITEDHPRSLPTLGAPRSSERMAVRRGNRRGRDRFSGWRGGGFRPIPMEIMGF